LQTGFLPVGRRALIFGNSMSERGCLMAAGRRSCVASMSVGARGRRKIEAGRNLCEKTAQARQRSVKLGINTLFQKFKTGRMGTVRRKLRQQGVEYSRWSPGFSRFFGWKEKATPKGGTPTKTADAIRGFVGCDR
jgi:hypothetical protein